MNPLDILNAVFNGLNSSKSVNNDESSAEVQMMKAVASIPGGRERLQTMLTNLQEALKEEDVDYWPMEYHNGAVGRVFYMNPNELTPWDPTEGSRRQGKKVCTIQGILITREYYKELQERMKRYGHDTSNIGLDQQPSCIFYIIDDVVFDSNGSAHMADWVRIPLTDDVDTALLVIKAE